ncbi:MAG: DNA polymerase III subunit gamma/tau [Planctomycetota bacterium]|nr:DNA polymerase III subunit gamma/tau [Planctomycetota bacterium]
MSRDQSTKTETSSKSTAHLQPQASSHKPSAGYTVLARRYRSRDFDELIGQDPIAQTLRNAVESGRCAHAYLFCGTRGVGKTSMARILAKALNVTDDLQQADEIAEAILRGDDLDVIEIDGASNRGINEAKDLIAAAGLSPARCRYKIYIIDEVHMLTTQAFNVLLKTMEEPPSHVKFILCTTEPHKIPATIQSRCQRFDFRLISTAQISGQLRAILNQEEVEAQEEVVAQIARLGRGSMRDALSLLDRLLAAGEKTLTTDLLEQMLGLPDHAQLATLVDAVAESDPNAALHAGAALLARGATVDQALEMLIEYLRNLMIISACGADSELVELSAEGRQVAAGQAQRFDPAGLVHMIALCDSVVRNTRGSAAAAALFDAAIVRLCMSEHLADIAALLDKGPGDPPAALGEGRKKKEPVITAPPSSPKQAPHGDATAVIETKPVAGGDATLDGRQIWAKVQAGVSDSPGESAKIERLAYQSFDGRTLRLAVDTDDVGLARWLVTQTEALADLVRHATGRSLQIELDTTRAQAAETPRTKAERIDQARQLPLVTTAMEIFDATIVDVQDSSEPPARQDNAAESAHDV